MRVMRSGTRVVLWLAALLLATSAAMAQPKSVPAVPAHLVLKGYDPVAYFTDGKPTPGKSEFETEFDGNLYRFASASHLEQFKADPDRYMPQFNGSCAGMMSQNRKVEADPENWRVLDGKLYVFLAPVDKQRSREDYDRLVAAAQHHWEILKDQPFE